MTNRSWSFLPWAVGSIGAGYLAYRWFSSYRNADANLSVADKLPIAKDLQTIPDVQGNYDIDGVSYDDEGVIVSGDNNKTIVAPV